MEWLLNKIERVRQYSDWTRTLLLWALVVVSVALISGVWLASSSVLSAPVGTVKREEAVSPVQRSATGFKFPPESFVEELRALRGRLPSIRELLAK